MVITDERALQGQYLMVEALLANRCRLIMSRSGWALVDPDGQVLESWTDDDSATSHFSVDFGGVVAVVATAVNGEPEPIG